MLSPAEADKIMDMAIANLFKHNVFFRLVGHDPDQYMPLFYSKGYHYVSNEIENGESIGFSTTHDVYGRKMRPLFRYILSNIMRDLEEENVDRISIKVHLIHGEDHEDHIIYSENFEDGFSIETSGSTFYTHPRILLNDKFSIYVEAYAYFIKKKTISIAPTVKAYREDCCVICLESTPNILYLDCLHIAVCDSCDDMKRTPALRMKCDVCRAKISRRIKI